MNSEQRRLTMKHLETWDACGGDVDGWTRRGRSPDMRYEHWLLIDELLQGLHLIRSGLASQRYADRIRGTLLAVTDDEAVRNKLDQMSGGIR